MWVPDVDQKDVEEDPNQCFTPRASKQSRVLGPRSPLSPERLKFLSTKNIDVIGKKAKVIMTLDSLKKICRRKNLYDTPHINDVIYLNFEGYTQIDQCLQKHYYNLKSLFLEGNSIREIEHLENLRFLKGLYLQNNIISHVENLDSLVNLSQIDLSNNRITSISNTSFENLNQLESLNLKNNLLKDLNQLNPIIDNPCSNTITCLDLSGNRFDDEDIIDLLAKMRNLKLLYLRGNPFLETMDFYRKKTIAKLRKLTFLDDRPIFENERRLNDVWMIGGRVAEQQERIKIKEEQELKRLKTKQERRRKYELRRAAMMARIEKETKNENDGDVVTINANNKVIVSDKCNIEEVKQTLEDNDVIHLEVEFSNADIKNVNQNNEYSHETKDEESENELEQDRDDHHILLPGMVDVSLGDSDNDTIDVD